MTFDERIIRVDSSAQGKVLSEWLRENGHMILLPCGGRGVCGKCRVKVIDGVFLNVADRAPATPDSDGCVKSCQVLCGAGEAHIKLPLHEATGLSVEHESEKNTEENCGADNTKHYSAAIADALELGALRREAVKLTYEQMAYIERIQPLGVPLNVLTTIAEYYIANKPYDSDWCVLPVTNIEAYLGSSALNKQYMNKIPTEFMQKKETSYGIAVCKITL